MPTTDVVIVGASGHGRWHLRNLHRLGRAGVRLVGVCDLHPLRGETARLAGGVPRATDLEELLEAAHPQVVVVCTPIHTHVDLALTAARKGASVLLEKPPAPSMAGFERLQAGLEETGVSCQVGFQSLGSETINLARQIVAAGDIGEVKGIGAAGAWIRTRAYWSRSRWAGRRHLDGETVMDGALTNPFAHATATALALDDCEQRGNLNSVELELHRAAPIHTDDTSCLRLVTAKNTVITVAVTLAAGTEVDPYLVVHGTDGRLTLWYKRDALLLERGGESHHIQGGRVDLMENLVAHIRDPGVDLLVPPIRTGAFMEMVEAVRTSPEPVPIPDRFLKVEERGDDAYHVVAGVEEIVQRSAAELATFSELGVPWAGQVAFPQP